MAEHVSPSRRSVVRGAAWSVPVVAVAATAPAFAASPCAVYLATPSYSPTTRQVGHPKPPRLEPGTLARAQFGRLALEREAPLFGPGELAFAPRSAVDRRAELADAPVGLFFSDLFERHQGRGLRAHDR